MAQYQRWSTPHTLAASCLGEPAGCVTDIQMQLVCEQEDAYWHVQFALQPYYVPGRGYDQYKPAYELGWQAALLYPDAEFSDLCKALEMQWSHKNGTSLLPWREVHQAVKAAWLRASFSAQKMQEHVPALVDRRDLAGALQPLYKCCQSLVHDLARLRGAPMNEFAQQVLDRHIRVIQGLAQGLEPAIYPQERASNAVMPWSKRLYAQWLKFKSGLLEWAPGRVFEVCEQRERGLLSAYQRILRNSLPEDVKHLLQQQVKVLQNNLRRLHWLQKNWAL